MRKFSNTKFKATHQGQALVEYAILLILLVTLFVGGTELGITALASNKNTEAAKTGISEYAEVNQQRLNIINTEKQYLLDLRASQSSSSCAIYGKDEDDNNVQDSPSAGFKCSQIGDFTINYTSYVDYLDSMVMVSTDDANTTLQIYALRTISDSDKNDDLVDYDSNNDEELSESELKSAIDSIKENTALTPENKLFKLILVQHIRLSMLPLELVDINNDDIPMSIAKIKTGAINTGIVPASCNGNTYNYGFPNGRYPYNNDTDDETFVKTVGGQVYLFHPLPIDVSSCAGTDDTREGRSRLRILIDGFGDAKDADGDGVIDNPLFVPGLPKLNQAMYSNYENVCVDATNAYVSCTSNNVAQRWLKPPGKICFNIVPDTVDACPDLEKHTANANLVAANNSHGPTGFYFFANASDSPPRSYEYTQTDADRHPSPPDGFIDFSPTIQLECSATPNKNSEDIFEESCNGNPSKIRIHTRYRRVFDGFLTFGLMELTQPNLLPYFYNPNQVGIAQNTIIGGYGSEVGPLDRNGNPTIKHFMDFRGCYELDVETNQISACN